MKTCRTCGRSLPVEEFYSHRARTGGVFRSSYCKPCHRARTRMDKVRRRARLATT